MEAWYGLVQQITHITRLQIISQFPELWMEEQGFQLCPVKVNCVLNISVFSGDMGIRIFLLCSWFYWNICLYFKPLKCISIFSLIVSFLSKTQKLKSLGNVWYMTTKWNLFSSVAFVRGVTHVGLVHYLQKMKFILYRNLKHTKCI